MQKSFVVNPDTESSSPVAETEAEYKEVVVIGNGPSAIAVSYLLSGHWPYYRGNEHSVEFLHYRLMENKDLSLVEQDLEFLCAGLEGRSSNPVSVLFDLLSRPDADLGLVTPSCLQWIDHEDKAVEHVVIGRGKPGGSWQSMEGSTLTISLGNWMELPNMSYKDWESLRHRDRITGGCSKQNRATVRSVAQYYNDYVHAQKMSSSFRNNSEVTRVTRLPSSSHPSGAKWTVEGHEYSEAGTKSRFVYTTRNVVLATGSNDLPNRLNVPGEDLPFVVHSLSELEWLICTRRVAADSDPVLIVGAGLSSADAVIAAHFYGIPVVHAFRRCVMDRSLIFNKLPENMYPEYHKVHQMMQGKGIGYHGYQALARHHVVQVDENRKVRLQGPSTGMAVKVSYVVVLIGSHPDLSFLIDNGRSMAVHPDRPVDGRENPINVDLVTHESVAEPSVYALGPLVGDNFVRFVQGGALAIASHLHKKDDWHQQP